jgi:ectoine hydroxylase-related dioxygenase (phytanoyl-CoA dioxygenase family)
VQTTRYVFGAPPPSDLAVTVTAEQRASYAEHGYLVVDRITTDEELEWLGRVHAEIFEGGASFVFEPGRSLADDRPFRLAQTIHPEIQYPELLATTYCRNARAIASQLLGKPADALTTWGYMLRLRPRNGRAVPWHQDEAYWAPEADYDAVGAWLSLHDTTEARGALRFVPGSHTGEVLHHDEAGDVPETLLVADGVDDASAVTCEVPLGGATFHAQRTLVSMGQNRSRSVVQSYVIEVQSAPVRRAAPRLWPWTEHRRKEMDEWDDPLVYVADGRIVPVP